MWVAGLVSGFRQAGELRQRILWQSIDTLTVLGGTGAIELRIETIGITAVPGRHNLPGHAGNHRVGGEFLVFGDDRMSRNDRVLTYFRTIHDGGIDADQTPITDFTPVQGGVVRNRTVLSDDRG